MTIIYADTLLQSLAIAHEIKTKFITFADIVVYPAVPVRTNTLTAATLINTLRVLVRGCKNGSACSFTSIGTRFLEEMDKIISYLLRYLIEG